MQSLTEKGRLMAVSYFVKADIHAGYLPVNDGEFAANRFPRESVDRLLYLHTIHGNLFLPHVEDFEVVRHTL